MVLISAQEKNFRLAMHELRIHIKADMAFIAVRIVAPRTVTHPKRGVEREAAADSQVSQERAFALFVPLIPEDFMHQLANAEHHAASSPGLMPMCRKKSRMMGLSTFVVPKAEKAHSIHG